MPTEDADDNKAYCRAYHARLKADPEKYARRLASIAEARKRRRASGVSPVSKPVKQPVKPMAQPVKQPVKPCEAPVKQHPIPATQPPQTREKEGCVAGGKHSASKTQGDVGLSADELLSVWQEHFDKQDLELERDAIREFGGG